MHELKTGLNADKFATFWMFPKRLSLIRFVNGPHTLYKPLNTLSQVDLRDFEKHVNQGKTRC